MKSNFNTCLTKVLKDEGGYSDDKSDSGGPTNFGITIADVRRYIKKNATAQDVRNLSINQAKNIYKSKYWDALSCNDLASGVDYSCFDYGVNSGLGRPRKALQKFNSLRGSKLIDAINDERTAFLKRIGIGSNSKFLRGWLNRVSRVRAYSKQLAQKDHTSGPIAGGLAGILTAWMTNILNFWHNHEVVVLAGSASLAVIVCVLVHLYRNKNNG